LAGGYVDGCEYNNFAEQTIMINFSPSSGIYYCSPAGRTGLGMQFTNTNQIYFLGSGSISI